MIERKSLQNFFLEHFSAVATAEADNISGSQVNCRPQQWPRKATQQVPQASSSPSMLVSSCLSLVCCFQTASAGSAVQCFLAASSDSSDGQLLLPAGLHPGSFCQWFTVTLQTLVLPLNTGVTAAAAVGLVGLLLCGPSAALLCLCTAVTAVAVLVYMCTVDPASLTS